MGDWDITASSASDDWSPTDAQPAPDPWAITQAAPIDPNVATVKPDSATRTIDVLRHPVRSAQALWDYSKERAANTARHYTSTGGLSGLAGDALQQAQDIQEAKDRGLQNPEAYAAAQHARRIADERAAAPKEATTIPEQVAGFAGDIAGSIATPESMIALPEKAIAIPARPFVSGVLRHAAGGAIATTAADLASQATQAKRGYQDGWDITRTVEAPFVGAAAGAGFHAAGHVVGEAADIAGFLADGPKGIPSYEPAARATVADLWPQVLGQEHGTDERGNQNTSPAGAKGPAQLMPGTAEQVAKSIGRPDLAAKAFENTPEGNMVNDMLGQVYLGQQLKAFDGNPVLALAAYNAGPGAVRHWIRTYGHPDSIGAERWLAMIPYSETRNYVQTILGGTHLPSKGYDLTSQDMAYMRGRMPEFPDQETQLSPIERMVKEEADRDAAEPQPTPTPPAVDDSFPGDHPATTSAEDAFPGDIPWDGEKNSPPAEKENPEPPVADLTDRALDQMRSGKAPKVGEGPSLAEFLVGEGGIRDDGGEIANLLGGKGEDRFWKQLRRAKTGITLSEAIERAQREGYIGKPLGDQAGEFTQGEAADREMLLEALRREIAGEKIYPPDRVNHDARELGAHMQDIDEVLQHLGLDIHKMSNADIKAAIEDFMRGHETMMHGDEEFEPGALGRAAPEVLGMAPKGAMATGAEAVTRARAAAQRLVQRQAIVDASTVSKNLRGARKFTAVPSARDMGGVIDRSLWPTVENVPDIVRRLAKDLGYPVRQGRLGLRDALGTYSRRTGLVALQGRYDIDTIAHEFGHSLEFSDGHGLPHVMAAMNKHAATLKALDYAPKQARRHEGFAEWLRMYVTNPAFADTLPGAAAFRQDFEAALAQDAPKALKALQRAQASYETLHTAPSVVVAKSHIVNPEHQNFFTKAVAALRENTAEALSNVGHEIYRGVWASLHPWVQATEEALKIDEARTGVRRDLSVMQDPARILRSQPSIVSAGHMDIIKGVSGYHSLQVESPALAVGIDHAVKGNWDPDLINSFDTYLVGRRLRHLYARVGQVWTDAEGVRHGMEQDPDKLSAQLWEQSTRELEELHPEFAEAADMIYDWNGALWKKRRDGGLINTHQFQSGLDDHPDYVPLFRDISDKPTGGDVGGERGRNTKNIGGTVRIKGSDAAYISPLHSMMNMAYELNAQLNVNDALKALDDMGQAYGPDIAHVVYRVPPTELKGTNTSVEEAIANAAKQYGVSRRDAMVITDAVRQLFGAAPEDAMGARIWRAQDMSEKGEHFVYVWRDGERIPLHLPDGKWGEHMVEALAGTPKLLHHPVVKFLSLPARVLRLGITAWPTFIASNAFKDQFSIFALTNVGVIPFWDFLRGMRHELGARFGGADELTRIYNSVGGAIGGYESASAHEAAAKRNLAAVKQSGRTVKQFSSLEGLAHFAEMSETGSRLAVFERGMDQARRDGFGDYEAAREGAYVARDYMDFDRHGGWLLSRLLSQIVPFFNASMQGLDKFGRVTVEGFANAPAVIRHLYMNGPPVTAAEQRSYNLALKLWATGGVAGIVGLAISAYYKNDPEYDELYQQLRNTHWVIKTPDGEYAVAPKPFDIGAFSNVFERAYEGAHLKDPEAWGHMLQGLLASFAPPTDAPIFSIEGNIDRNRDNLGAPIVPEYLQGKQARDQYTERTSAPAKFIGGAAADATDWIGKHVPGMEGWAAEHAGGISPAQIDYRLKGYTGSAGRTAINAMGSGAPVAHNLSDTPFLERFVKEWSRGANSSRMFYGLIGAKDGLWSQAVTSVDGLINSGKYPEATARLQAMDPVQRGYVMTTLFADGDHHDPDHKHGDPLDGQLAKQDHPMIRAYAAAKVFNDTARDLGQGEIRGPDLQPIKVTPEERRDAITALHRMAVAEERNAMIMAGAHDWAGKQPLPQTKYLLALNRAAPQIVPALDQRMADAKVQDMGYTVQNWPAWRHALEGASNPQVLAAMMEAKRFPEGKKGPTAKALERAHQDVVPVTP